MNPRRRTGMTVVELSLVTVLGLGMLAFIQHLSVAQARVARSGQEWTDRQRALRVTVRFITDRLQEATPVLRPRDEGRVAVPGDVLGRPRPGRIELMDLDNDLTNGREGFSYHVDPIARRGPTHHHEIRLEDGRIAHRVDGRIVRTIGEGITRLEVRRHPSSDRRASFRITLNPGTDERSARSRSSTAIEKEVRLENDLVRFY